MTTVLEPDGRLAGIVTDGDLRRLMEKHRGATFEMSASAAMTRNPQTIGPHVLVSEALNQMEKRKITSVVVVDERRRVSRCRASPRPPGLSRLSLAEVHRRMVQEPANPFRISSLDLSRRGIRR